MLHYIYMLDMISMLWYSLFNLNNKGGNMKNYFIYFKSNGFGFDFDIEGLYSGFGDDTAAAILEGVHPYLGCLYTPNN